MLYFLLHCIQDAVGEQKKTDAPSPDDSEPIEDAKTTKSTKKKENKSEEEGEGEEQQEEEEENKVEKEEIESKSKKPSKGDLEAEKVCCFSCSQSNYNSIYFE